MRVWRLARHILNALTVLSLLLWVTAAVLWADGSRRGRRFGSQAGTLERDGARVAQRVRWWSWDGNGVVVLWRENHYLFGLTYGADGEPVGTPTAADLATAAAAFDLFRPAFERDDARDYSISWAESDLYASYDPAFVDMPGQGPAMGGVNERDYTRGLLLNLPFPHLLLATAVLPAAWGLPLLRRRRVRRHRLRNHLCLACGYDLRTTPDRCPECGAVPAK